MSSIVEWTFSYIETNVTYCIISVVHVVTVLFGRNKMEKKHIFLGEDNIYRSVN